ncbi:MAG: glycosyltransferase family 4 protein [Bacteriovoracaceae bacterium]
MHKIACLFSFQESSWVSCQKIVFNLHKTYEAVPGHKILNFDYNHESVGTDLIKLVMEIERERPDTIVILDHKPHPIYLLSILFSRMTDWPKPRIIFHVFGDFTLYYKEWYELSKLLKDFPVEFVVASDRQKILIDQFLIPPMASVVCPFPVMPEDFYFDPDERSKQRKEWGVNDDDVVFTFTGRISRQKRAHLLLKSFHEALERDPHLKARLYIYGQPDDLGDNFLNQWENENEYFRKIHRLYQALPSRTRERIHFMGNYPNKELRSVYAGADYFINLSVHNDEDFGMSVAEAQFCGLPSILTDWGGLASFEHHTLPEATKFLKVTFGQHSKIIRKEAVVNAILEAAASAHSFPREKLVELSRQKFSVQIAAEIIEKTLERKALPFVSFSEFHTTIARRMMFRKPVYMTRQNKISPIYRKLYTSYVRNNS